jgi:hypothetical protein
MGVNIVTLRSDRSTVKLFKVHFGGPDRRERRYMLQLRCRRAPSKLDAVGKSIACVSPMFE